MAHTTASVISASVAPALRAPLAWTFTNRLENSAALMVHSSNSTCLAARVFSASDHCRMST